jgi:hypothetical protein
VEAHFVACSEVVVARNGEIGFLAETEYVTLPYTLSYLEEGVSAGRGGEDGEPDFALTGLIWLR